jgi:hypothetical protein
MAFLLETNRLIERINQIIEAFLCEFINHAQYDWLPWLSIVVAIIYRRDSISTGLNPFFLLHS